jgi:hypothetical protein
VIANAEEANVLKRSAQFGCNACQSAGSASAVLRQIDNRYRSSSSAGMSSSVRVRRTHNFPRLL